jgi:hypothetical protein
MVGRIKLPFVPGLEVEFTDREKALKQVYEFGERGTRFPIVVFGPEGCGKTAWLKQAVELLRELGFEVLYVNPLHKEFITRTDVGDVVRRFSEALAEVIGITELRLATLAIDLTKELLKKWKVRKVALLVDDVFQAIGLDKVEVYVKSLLNLIEYPPEMYEGIVVIVATSEGLSRVRIGRHSWAEVRPIWNLGREGFEELYEVLSKVVPNRIPGLDELWLLTGGNPRMLSQLYLYRWDVELVIKNFIESKKLIVFISSLSDDEREWLFKAVEDPDTLMRRERIPLLNKLVELNLVVDDIVFRDEFLWIDEPPKTDLELGIGKYVAWQTPIHREAVRRVLRS